MYFEAGTWTPQTGKHWNLVIAVFTSELLWYYTSFGKTYYKLYYYKIISNMRFDQKVDAVFVCLLPGFVYIFVVPVKLFSIRYKLIMPTFYQSSHFSNALFAIALRSLCKLVFHHQQPWNIVLSYYISLLGKEKIITKEHCGIYGEYSDCQCHDFFSWKVFNK